MLSVKRIIVKLIAFLSLIIILFFVVLEVAAAQSSMVVPVSTAPFKVVSIIGYSLRQAIIFTFHKIIHIFVRTAVFIQGESLLLIV